MQRDNTVRHLFSLSYGQKSLILRGRPRQCLAGAGRRGHVGHARHHVLGVQACVTLYKKQSSMSQHIAWQKVELMNESKKQKFR